MSVIIILFLGFITSFLITIFTIPNLIRLAKFKGLVDVPDNRKVHHQPIPSLGGIAFFITFWLVTFSLANWDFLLEFRFILIGSFLLFLVSLKDDLVGIKPIKRLIIQFVVATLCYFSGFQVEGMYGILGVNELPEWINFPLTLLTIGLIINAYNLIDGINGLAGSLGVSAMFIFALLFGLQGATQWSLIALIIAGSIIGFLRFNFGNASIFMGDNGSTFIGLITAVFFLKFINSDSMIWEADQVFVIGLSAIFIPIFDLIRVFFVRISKGGSPMKPDKTHLHHFLLDMGKSHVWICCFIMGMHFLACLMGTYFTDMLGITFGLALTIIIELIVVLGILSSLQLTNIKKMESNRHTIGYLE